MIRKALLVLALLASGSAAQALPLLTENFDDIGALSGWTAVNKQHGGW